MTHLLTAVTTRQLFRTLVVAGTQLYLCLCISGRPLRAVDEQHDDPAVAALLGHKTAGGAEGGVAAQGTAVRTAGGAGQEAGLCTLLTLVAGGNQVTLPAAGVIPAGQRSSTRLTARETTLTVTRHRAHLMFSKTGRWYGDCTRCARQSFLNERRSRRLLPGTGQPHLLALDGHQVVARQRAGVCAAGAGPLAGLPAGGAGEDVAAVRLPAGVVAGGGAPAGLLAARRFGAAFSSAGHRENGGSTGTLHLHLLRTRITASWMTARGTLVVATAEAPPTALVTRRAVTGATLSPALVSLAAPGFRTL